MYAGKGAIIMNRQAYTHIVFSFFLQSTK